MARLNLSIPVPDVNWSWFGSQQAAGVVRFVLAAGGPLGAWLLQHSNISIFQLDLLTNFIIAGIAAIPPAAALISGLISNTKSAQLDRVANFTEVSNITVNTDSLSPPVSNPKVSLNGIAH